MMMTRDAVLTRSVTARFGCPIPDPAIAPLAQVADRLSGATAGVAVVIGRGEPNLSLTRLRVDGRVVEITADELALTVSEARAIFASIGVGRHSADLTARSARAGLSA